MIKYKTYDPTYDYLYVLEIVCFDEDGKEIHTYDIEADTEWEAIDAAKEFCNDDYPFKRIGEITITSKEKIKYVQNR